MTRSTFHLALVAAALPFAAGCTADTPLTPRMDAPAEALALASPLSKGDAALLLAGCDDALVRLLPAGNGAAVTPLHAAIRTLRDRLAAKAVDVRANDDAISAALTAVHAELDRRLTAAPADAADLEAIRLELSTPTAGAGLGLRAGLPSR